MNEITNYFSHFFKDCERGANPIMGQIFGILIQKNEPVALSEIAKELELSKAAISIHIRYLNDLGYCVKLPRKQDRKDYYTINEFFISQLCRNKLRQLELYSEEIKRIVKTVNKDEKSMKKRLVEFKNYFDEEISLQKSILSKFK